MERGCQTADRPAACVVLSAPGAEPDRGLVESLGRRGVGVTRVCDAYAAMAELCVIGRSEPARASALVIAEPDRVPGRARLVAAADVYAPAAVVWTYEQGANPALRPIVEQSEPVGESCEGSGVAAEPKPGGRATRGGSPMLRLVGDGAAPKDDAGDGGEKPIDLDRLLSPDELSMLLNGQGLED